MPVIKYYVLGGIALGTLLGWLLGRRAVLLGAFFVLADILPFIGVCVSETYLYTTGDTSATGMGATIALILCTPFGVALMLSGLIFKP